MSDIQKLLNNGQVNEYFHNLLSNRSKVVSPDVLSSLIEQAQVMSNIGVCGDNDHCQFFLITTHAKPIAQDLMGDKISDEQLAALSDILYKNRNECPIDNIHNFYDAVAKAMNKVKLPIKKMAYPQDYSGVFVRPSYNISKWMNSVKEIYAMSQRNNIEIKQAFDEVTKQWDEKEKMDFSHWMRFYQSGGHERYKMAQYAPTWGEDQTQGRGYYVPGDLKATMPGMPDMANIGGGNQDIIEEEAQQVQKETDTKELLNALRGKVLARLTAAERLLSGDDGRNLAGDELVRLLEGIHALKRQVLSLKTAKTVSDLIIKEANRLQYGGFYKGASALKIIAQEMPMPDMGAMPMPDMGGGAPAPAPDSEDPNAPRAMDIFISRLREGLGGAEKILKKQPKEAPMAEAPMAEPMAPTDIEAIAPDAPEAPVPEEGEKKKTSSYDDEAAIIVEAQEVPLEPAAMPTEPLPTEVPELEVEENEAVPSDTKVEDAFDAALSNITVSDVITRLENLATIFKHREIARELGIVDMMLDKLGMASYFPNLAEAMQKALEANQYSLTRIEDILNKVRGAASEPNLNMHEDREFSEQERQIQEGLETAQQVERDRKERRQARRDVKDQEAMKAEQAQEVPEAVEELRQPAEVERAAPVPIR